MNVQNFFEKFLRFCSSHSPFLTRREVKFIKMLLLKPGLSYIADIGIKQTGIGKFTPNFQRKYRSNSFRLGDISNFVSFEQFSVLFLTYTIRIKVNF